MIYNLYMAFIRNSSYIYLVDGLSANKAELLRKALMINDKIDNVSVKLNSGIVDVKASKDPTFEVQTACSIAGCTFRMKVSKRKAAYYS